MEVVLVDDYGRSDSDQWGGTRERCGEVSCQKLMFNVNEEHITILAFHQQTDSLSAGVAGDDEGREEGRKERRREDWRLEDGRKEEGREERREERRAQERRRKEG